MCLTTVDSKTVKITGGWKVFRIEDNGKLFPSIYDNLAPSKGFKRGMWYTSRGYTILAHDHKEYDAGFHFFETKEDAIVWCEPEKGEVVKKISARNIVASGWQILITKTGRKTMRVFVAKEMRIDEEES